MNVGHIHIGFQDLEAAVSWSKQVLGKDPVFRNETMAVFECGGLSLVFDRSERDSELCIAFASESCDRDCRRLEERGAVVTERPEDQPWGVRTAYLQGPGRVTFELEEALA
jgi:catechol 2,3-dioxygenase-like lactoylglutathione lyase family enzyme